MRQSSQVVVNKLQIQNYKCFNQLDTVTFSDGFSLLIGKNNTGKSALIEALSLTSKAVPHLSRATKPNSDSSIQRSSTTQIEVGFTAKELRRLLCRHTHEFFVPAPPSHSEIGRNLASLSDAERISHFKRWLFYSDNVYSMQIVRVVEGGEPVFRVPSFPTFLPYGEGNPLGWYTFKALGDDVEFLRQASVDLNSKSEMEFGVKRILPLISSLIFAFRAERTNVGECLLGSKTTLAPDASNLAEVIQNLQASTEQFTLFNKYVHEVLPQVKSVSARVTSDTPTLVEILVWPSDLQQNRLDLAIPLKHCGTGVSQVLGILYVAVVSDFPQVIIIDEPQSFLHRGAARTLMTLLAKHFSQHQFIVATHSPTVISALADAQLMILQQSGGETSIESLSKPTIDDQRRILADVGATLSDVFGAENIFWVEGPTEAECFPMIAEALTGGLPTGTVVKAVRAPGDLLGKKGPLIFDIYDRLSRADSLIPPAIAFEFDGEKHSDEEKYDLRKRSKHPIEFLNRYCYENYLLDPEGIANLIADLTGFSEPAASPERIAEYLEEKRGTADYESWLTTVDAARLLEDLFQDLSEGRYFYQKTKHSPLLTKWLLSNRADSLREVANLIKRAVKPSGEL